LKHNPELKDNKKIEEAMIVHKRKALAAGLRNAIEEKRNREKTNKRIPK
jgi:hypothetical protein